MQAKIDTIITQDKKTKEEYLLYPKTLTKAIKDEKGNRLDNILTDMQNRLVNELDSQFLTEEGYGGLRFINGKFQYYDTETATWIDTSVGPENVYIINMIPKEMKSISVIYDIALGLNKLKWEEASDTIVDGQVLCLVDKVVIRRKLGSVPLDETDGDLVIEIPRSKFGQYKNTYYIDSDVIPVEGDIYFYKAFPQSTMGHYNYATVNEASAAYKECKVFGFRIDQTESDPDNMITYIADNENFKSCYMDYNNNTFNYGDWTKENGAWFMNVKPCMLKYDGTVAYYLNPDDYTLKEDGTASDIANPDFEGNVMIEFPKVYYKCVNISDDVAEYYFSNSKIDDEYYCWSHIDNHGNEIDYCYMPAYNGYYDGTRLRSISGQLPLRRQTIQTVIDYATANNLTEDAIWNIEVFSDRQLLNLLLSLIGKSTDGQTIFGNGLSNAVDMVTSGTLNNKGLFYGTNEWNTAMKAFGIEHYWGNGWRKTVGCIGYYGIQKVKMVYGQFDGSTVDGYNITSDGYIDLGLPELQKHWDSITKMAFTKYGLIPIAVNGSATTYYCDHMHSDNTCIGFHITGGHYTGTTKIGIFGFGTGSNVSAVDDGSHITSISCKPLSKPN